MVKEIIVNANISEEIQVAIIENFRLIDIDIDNPNKTKKKGNIFKGFIVNIEDGLEAAFVEFGNIKQAFLPLSEIRNDLYLNLNKKTVNSSLIRMSNILIRGQEIIIQVMKDTIGSKGVTATTYLSIPGRYLVLMHSDNMGGGISKKIVDVFYRKQAKIFMSTIEMPEGIAIIMRTASTEAKNIDLLYDLKKLCKVWNDINISIKNIKAPKLIYKEPNIVIRTIRDYFTNDVSLIIIDNKYEYRQAINYFKQYMISANQVIVHYNKIKPIFDYYGLTAEISQLYHSRINLVSGGYIIIEQTEALVSIDVNSGKTLYLGSHEMTVYKTNLEASREIARQLRLRDLGGIIVIDFIDMISVNHRNNIKKQIKLDTVFDKAKIKISSISDNGTLELTRQRIRQSYKTISFITCHNCKGTGQIRTLQSLITNALRQIFEFIAKHHIYINKIITYLPLRVANILVNKKRKTLLEISEMYFVDVYIYGDDRLNGEKIVFCKNKRKNIYFLLKNEKNLSVSHFFFNKFVKITKKDFFVRIGPTPILIQRHLFSHKFKNNTTN